MSAHPFNTATTAQTQWTVGGPWAHSCNCIGCCRRCGTCRTWHGHTQAYCDLLLKQASERDSFLSTALRREAVSPLSETAA